MMVPALLVTLICAAPALASEGGHDAPRWGDFGWRCLNLVIFVAILWHFVGKMTVNFFRNRKKNIEEGIDNLQARREAAEAHLAEIETRIANLDAERAAILDESKAQAEALKQDIIAKAQEQAKQIVEMAKVAAESEGQNIIQQVRATIADELIEATREQLLASLNKKNHEQLIDKSLEKVVLQ
jgi:F-type H+-transporting ATPase subunit b